MEQDDNLKEKPLNELKIPLLNQIDQLCGGPQITEETAETTAEKGTNDNTETKLNLDATDTTHEVPENENNEENEDVEMKEKEDLD